MRVSGSTATRPGSANGAGPSTTSAPPGAPPRAVLPRGRRRPGLIVGSALLLLVGALVTAWLVAMAGDRTPVVVTTRDLAYGETIEAADLATTDVAVDAMVATVPGSDLDALVGQVAAGNLPAGSLVGPGSTMPAPPPGEGELLAPIGVPAEVMPAGSLHAGDRVLVVDTTAGAGVSAQPIPVRVVRTGVPDVNGTTVVDVTVDERAGPRLASVVSTGEFSLLVQPVGGVS